MIRAGFIGIQPVLLHRAPCLEGSLICYCCLEMLNNFGQGPPHFHFALDPTIYVASPGRGIGQIRIYVD